MSADFYITIKFRVRNCWEHDDPECTDANVEAMLRDEGLMGCVDDEYEFVAIERIADEEAL